MIISIINAICGNRKAQKVNYIFNKIVILKFNAFIAFRLYCHHRYLKTKLFPAIILNIANYTIFEWHSIAM